MSEKTHLRNKLMRLRQRLADAITATEKKSIIQEMNVIHKTLGLPEISLSKPKSTKKKARRKKKEEPEEVKEDA